MLEALSIRDVVLIDILDLDFTNGLNALSGETGAGKSILLDSLGLALGRRADSGLVRAGADRLSVSATFVLPPDHPARALLAENDIDMDDDTLILRRTVTGEGRGKAFINDAPVSAGLLRDVGDTLVEVHGQFDTHGLLNPAHHLGLLDDMGGAEHRRALAEVSRLHGAWQAARRALTEAADRLARAQAEQDFLSAAVAELDEIAPRPDEEDSLARERTLLMSAEKLIDALQTARDATEGSNVETALRTALTALERVQDAAAGKLDETVAALDRALIETGEALSALDAAAGEFDADPQALERVESRLFDLRALARKHGVKVADLPALAEKFRDELATLEDGQAALSRLQKAELDAAADYDTAARRLSEQRRATAAALEAAVTTELPPLRMDKARFAVTLSATEDRTPTGRDRATFEVATNPGAAPGPLNKIASGGELARFMLALRVVMARAGAAPCLVFDEVDAGIGGATAAAVGDRLAQLARDVQVLVVTHAPQVAARANHHLLVAKSSPDAARTVTSVTRLSHDERREEIARMLSGAAITDAARAAADQLLTPETPA